jgi:hypothetical protein
VHSSAASPSDAPAAFVTYQQPRAGGKGLRANHNSQCCDNDAQASKQQQQHSQQQAEPLWIVEAFQIGLMVINRNTIDVASIGDLVENMTNESRKWRLSFETSESATLMRKLIIQKQHPQHRSCDLIWNVKRLVLIFLMSFQAWDL